MPPLKQAATVEILSQGDEIITGDIIDTNAAWLSEQMTRLGFEVTRRHTVGDRLQDLADILCEISGRADICLCTGGLGPTCDDLTAEAASLAFKRPLQLDDVALTQIRNWFSRNQRPMPEINARQALLPAGSIRMDNHWGTAPGFILTAGKCRLYFMPGVPREMKALFQASIEPQLRLTTLPQQRMVIHTIGIGESALQERLNDIALPGGVLLGFRAGGAENQVKLVFPGSSPSQSDIERVVQQVVDVIGEFVFAVKPTGKTLEDDDPLVLAAGRALAVDNASLFAVETLSGGRLAQRCCQQAWFSGSRVEPNPLRLAHHWLQHPPINPAADTARQLAIHIRQDASAEVALVQFFEPAPGLHDTRTALIDLHIALATARGTFIESRKVSGSRQQLQNSAAAYSLDAIRRLKLTQSNSLQ